jgi:hypothetical protein
MGTLVLVGLVVALVLAAIGTLRRDSGLVGLAVVILAGVLLAERVL